LLQDLPRNLFCTRFRKSPGKFAVNDILVYREILLRLCRALSACLSRLAEILLRLLPRLASNILAHFAASFSGNITAKFVVDFAAKYPRVYREHIRNYCNNNFALCREFCRQHYCYFIAIISRHSLQYCRGFCRLFAEGIYREL
jgi:hypothetical protein